MQIDCQYIKIIYFILGFKNAFKQTKKAKTSLEF